MWGKELIFRSILFYLKKKTEEKYTRVFDDMEVASHRRKGISVVVAHFSTDSSLKYKHFMSAIREDEYNDILISVGESKVSQPMDSFCVINTDDVVYQFTGKWGVDDIRSYIALWSLPTIVPYVSTWNRRIFDRTHHIREHLVYMSENNELQNNLPLREVFEQVSVKGRNQFLMLDLDPDERSMIDYFGFEREQLPILFYVDLRSDQGSIKYVYHDEEYTVEKVMEFTEKAHLGELYPFYKSEPVYTEPDGFVRRIVSRDFVDVAYDPYRNVLVEFVVPVGRREERIERRNAGCAIGSRTTISIWRTII